MITLSNFKDNVRDFKDLVVYKKSMDLSDKIYELTKKFPSDERFAMTDQIKRSVNSISANIAEGNGGFYREREAHFLNIALGSSNEVRCWLEHAYRKKYISKEEYGLCDSQCIEINKMLITLIKKLRNIN